MDGALAEIRGFAGTFAPKNWVYCHGQLADIAQNQALFSLIGNYYGGNGRTTFGIPDLRGRVPIGSGQGPTLPPYQLSQMGGYSQISLTNHQLPKHSHLASGSVDSGSLSGSITAKMKVNSAAGDEKSPDGQYLGASFKNLYQDSPTDGKTLNSNAISVDASGLSVSVGDVNVAVSQTGEGEPFPIVQPYLCINWIICVDGLYPQRPD